MILLAALAMGAAVWTAAAAAAGRPVTFRRSRPGRHHDRRLQRQIWLSQAGAAVTPGQFVAVSFATGAAGFVVFYGLARTVVVALVPAAALCAAPYAYWATERRKKKDAEVAAWPEAIRNLLASLQRGLTLHQGLEELAVSGPIPLRAHMARYGRLEPQVGRQRALETVRADLADTTADRILIALGLAFVKGNTLVIQILDQLATQAGEDDLLREKIATAAVMPRINMWGTFSVPYLILIFLCASQSFYRSFYSSSLGIVVVAGGLVASMAGIAIIKAINHITPEKRVFATTVSDTAAGIVATPLEAR